VLASAPAKRLNAMRDAAWDGPGSHVMPSLEFLTDACERAGVELGEWERGTLRWLANYETSVVAVIADLITRAHEAGRTGHGPLMPGSGSAD
jgi:hypothetical protein